MRKEVIDTLHTFEDHQVLLSDLVKNLEKSGFKRPDVYKVISNNNRVFRKIYLKELYYVQLIEKKGANNSNWDRSIEEILLMLSPVFEDTRQPNYSPSLKQCLATFKLFCEYRTQENSLNGLEESLLPSINSYFTGKYDKNDLLLILKDLVTSLDPFLKKILLVTNYSRFIEIKNGHKGLGAVLSSLGKIDPRNNRYKTDVRSASLYQFGKEIWLSYHYRNDRVHNASLISVNKIHEVIKATLVVYMYSIFEYNLEVKTVL